MSQEGYVNTEIINGVATVEFFHPQSNSLPGKILRELASQITDAGKNEEVKVIVLRSGGDRAFCAGASFDELVAIQNEAEGLEFFSGFAYVINAARTCGKIVVGRVQGKAVGGGVGLAVACDYTLATQYASVKLSELAIGIGPFVVGPAVEHKVGKAAFGQLALDATNWRSAQWAYEHGLYAEVLEDTSALDKAVDDMASRLCNSNPEALRELKHIIWEGTEHWDTLLTERAKISGRLVLSAFTKNAIAAFKAKA